ncbi:MAG: hypothetical protein AAB740_05750 [Patescibacteria group bacterium]|mgnify:CR=1 FL=1
MLIAKYLTWTLVLLALFFIELGLLPQLLPWGITIDLVFLLVFLHCFLREKKDYLSYWLAFLAGFLLDVYSGQLFFGFWLLFFILSAWLIKKMSFLMQGLNIFSFLINFLIAYLLYKFFALFFIGLALTWFNVAITMIATLAIGVISFFIYVSLHQKKS